MWNNSLRELWNIAPSSQCEIKFASSHLRSKYFTAELFHMAKPYFTRRRRISLKKAHIVLIDKCVLFSGAGDRTWTCTGSQRFRFHRRWRLPSVRQLNTAISGSTRLIRCFGLRIVRLFSMSGQRSWWNGKSLRIIFAAVWSSDFHKENCFCMDEIWISDAIKLNVRETTAVGKMK